MAELNLKQGPPNTAHARVSALAVYEKLETLDARADNPVEVRKWSERFWLELQECRVVV